MSASAEQLRRRPDQLRYFGMAVTPTGLHMWSSYGALVYVLKRHKVVEFYVADVVTGQVFKSPEPVEDFMVRWKRQYDNPSWDYKKDLDNRTAPGLS